MMTRQEKIDFIDAEIERVTEQQIEVDQKKDAEHPVGLCMEADLERWLGTLYYYKGLLEKEPKWVQMSDSLFRSYADRQERYDLEEIVRGGDTLRINQGTLLAAIFRTLGDLCHHFRVVKEEDDSVEINEIFSSED